MGPNLCEIKDVVAEFLRLVWRHCLLKKSLTRDSRECGETYDIDGPAWELLLFDELEQALNAVFRVGASEVTSLFWIERLTKVNSHSWCGAVLTNLEALVSTDVNLDVGHCAVLLDELVCVTRVSVHLVVTVGGSTIRE
jgi:hypothetical protein